MIERLLNYEGFQFILCYDLVSIMCYRCLNGSAIAEAVEFAGMNCYLENLSKRSTSVHFKQGL